MFVDQFEQDGTSFIYRRSQKGEAFRVTIAERDRFLEEFDNRVRRAKWIIYGGLGIVLGAVILLSARDGKDPSEPLIFAGIGVVMIPYFAYFRWAWAAPARQLVGRTPVAGERSSEEVRRLRFQRLSYGQLAGAALGGLAIPVFGASREDIFSGWERLWLVAGAALVLLAAVQAFRKWRVEQEYSYDLAGRPLMQPVTESADGAGSRDWRPIIGSIIAAGVLVGLAFVIFTPAGRKLAQTPSFWPIFMMGFGGWAFFTVAKAFTNGQIEPFVRGIHSTYLRETQPKRFWASVAWNSILGCICLSAGAFNLNGLSGRPTLAERCYNERSTYSAQKVSSACDRLLEVSSAAIQRDPQDATAYFNRGFVYEHKGDLQPAIADFTKVIRLAPNREAAYYYRWAAYTDLGDKEHAADDMAALSRLDPKFAASLSNVR